jgi:[acyl-carrier-protein] S-malonyltransferase
MSALIGLTIAEVEEIVAQGRTHGVVSVANHNTEKQVVITGEPAAVAAVADAATEKGAKAVQLKVSGAWHSDLIRGAEEDFRTFLQATAFHPPQCTIIFNTTAASESDPQNMRAMMAHQLCSPVKWFDAMQALVENGMETLVEIGPGRVLTGLLRKILPRGYSAHVYNVYDLKTFEEFIK